MCPKLRPWCLRKVSLKRYHNPLRPPYHTGSRAECPSVFSTESSALLPGERASVRLGERIPSAAVLMRLPHVTAWALLLPPVFFVALDLCWPVTGVQVTVLAPVQGNCSENVDFKETLQHLRRSREVRGGGEQARRRRRAGGLRAIRPPVCLPCTQPPGGSAAACTWPSWGHCSVPPQCQTVLGQRLPFPSPPHPLSPIRPGPVHSVLLCRPRLTNSDTSQQR